MKLTQHMNIVATGARLSMLVVVLLCFLNRQGAAAYVLPERDHPFLLADSAMIDRAKQRTQQYIWANNALTDLLTSANTALKYQTIPTQPGDAYSHKSYMYNVRKFGLAYALSGYEVYAEAGRNILMQYADAMPTWGYILDQILSDAVYGSYMIWGYDLVYNSPCFSAADRAHIEEHLFRPLAARMQSDVREGNHQAWHNALLIGIGLVIEDVALVDEALDGPRGLRWQLRNRVLNDGWWCETTPNYHVFALDAVRYTIQAAKLAGIDFVDNPAYKAMFDAPLRTMKPDFTLPSINDTATDYLMSESKRYAYEVAYAEFQDPAYLTILHLGPRDTFDALLFGVDNLPAPPIYHPQSVVSPEAGFAALRCGSGENEIYVHLDYGPHGEWHGHRDKLSIILYALGRELAPDLSVSWQDMDYKTPQWMYGHRQTVAHNTVCVDKVKQEQAEGQLRMFYVDPAFSLVQAQCCRNAYKTVLLRRTVAVADGYIVDVFECRSPLVHTYDWVYHNHGTASASVNLAARAEPIGQGSGYQYLANIRTGQADGNWQVDFVQDQANVRVHCPGTPATDVFLADMVMGSYQWPTLIARRQERETVFVSVIEPYADQPRISSVALLPEHQSCDVVTALEICYADGSRKDIFMLATSDQVQRTILGMTARGRAYYVRTEAGDIMQVHHVE